jgi:CBS domain-containing protein
MIITKGIGCLPVVDGTKLVGLITKTDLLRCLRMLATA